MARQVPRTIAVIPAALYGSIQLLGVVGLVIMGAPDGFMARLGCFSLAGILINNSIVLIDRIEQEEVKGRCTRRKRSFKPASHGSGRS